MPRTPRLFIPDQPLHLVVRGHSRSPITTRRRDYELFTGYLREATTRYGCAVHAWVLMSNHLHLLLTPANEDSLPRAMQWMGRNYARYFNARYGRSGALWEGRYKTSFIDTERYLLACYRYIEMNPVRACLVDAPEQYPWSSYRCNALGQEDALTASHPVYLSIANDAEQRRKRYRALFREALDRNTLTQFRRGANKCQPVGNPAFLLRVATMTGKVSGT